MNLGGPDLAHDRRVPRRDVADVRAKAVRRIQGVHPPHHPVARHLGDDRGGGDRGALLVAVDDGAVLRRGRPEPEAVDQADLGRRRELREHGAQAGEVRAVQPFAVDLGRGNGAHDDPLGAADDGAEEPLALGLAALLRVVQERERADAVVAQPRVVEQDARDEQRPGERPPARLVGAGDEARAEPTVELEKLPAGASRHGREDSAAASRHRLMSRFRHSAIKNRPARSSLLHVDARERAIEDLYRRKYVRFRNTLATITGGNESARDAVQEAFTRALRKRRSLRDEQALETWVWRSLSGPAFEHGRSQRRVDVGLQDVGEVALVEPERDPALAEALRRLPPRRRLIVFLRYFADLTYAEIAELCGVADGTVAAAIAQARAELKRTLDRDEVEV